MFFCFFWLRQNVMAIFGKRWHCLTKVACFQCQPECKLESSADKTRSQWAMSEDRRRAVFTTVPRPRLSYQCLLGLRSTEDVRWDRQLSVGQMGQTTLSGTDNSQWDRQLKALEAQAYLMPRFQLLPSRVYFNVSRSRHLLPFGMYRKWIDGDQRKQVCMHCFHSRSRFVCFSLFI